MRILYYNWADYRDAENRGGGVSVYQRNVIDGLAQRGGFETAFLSAGLAHDLHRRKPHVVTLEAGASPRYCMVNSGILAPSHAEFGGAAQLDHPETEAAFAAFVDKTGPWDVIHFNNLEGLPAHVLALKPRWPNTKFILSLHNYYPICPQVNLWQSELRHCSDFDGGARCTTCLPAKPEPRSVRVAYAMGWTLSRIGAGPGTAFYEKLFRPSVGFAWRQLRAVLHARHTRRAAAARVPPNQTVTPSTAAAPHAIKSDTIAPQPASRRPAPKAPLSEAAAAFGARRRRMVALINTHCDAVVCVSDRVRQIAEHYGIDHRIALTRYIGTREAEQWHHTHPRDSFLRPDGTIHLAFLGYMRRDKGFYFLMRALKALPPKIASRVRLTVAARTGDAEAIRLMAEVAPRLASLRHRNGYTHDDLRDLLSDVDVGLVPVQWEDNLPQVAIEMHSRHIPLLTSDRGGAQELGACPDLVFKAGDTADFAHVLTRILDGTTTTAMYWSRANPPVEMPEHLDALIALYKAAA